MKRPGLYLTILFVSIISSTVIVSTVISGIAKSFQKDEVNVKSAPAANNNGADQTTVKL